MDDDDDQIAGLPRRRKVGHQVSNSNNNGRGGAAMQVDRGGFLLCVAAFAVGGAGGYVASEKDLAPHLSGTSRGGSANANANANATPQVASLPIAPVSAETAKSAAPAAGALVVDAGPTCDDTVGDATSETCPPFGAPTVEGGCGGYAATRCNDFKQTMKPRIAKAAIACLNKLSGSERCDPKRVDLCAHQALMNACEDPAPAITKSCETLAEVCKGTPAATLPLSLTECRFAMSGLRETGREAMSDCVKKHCADKGVLGCQGQPMPKR